MAVKPVKTPFTNMSFTPDIPSAALGANEYNSGYNIETDIRGINSVAGDEEILNSIQGNVIFTTAGFRNNDIYWFVVATREGHWYAQTTSGISNVTPTANTYVSTSYTDSTAITDSWSGTTLIINDNVNPPMYLNSTDTEFHLYSNDANAAPNSYNWNYNPNYTALRAGFVRLYHNSVWASDCSYIDRSITPFLFFSYVFLKINQQILFDKQEGSAQPHIYPSHVMELEIPDYTKELLKDFENEVESMFQKIKSNTNQIKTLTNLRDTLLPKLMSGEVRVNN